MAAAHRRHDISDQVWDVCGRNKRSGQPSVNAVFWILRTGAPWRDLPPDYGDWKNTQWADEGSWLTRTLSGRRV